MKKIDEKITVDKFISSKAIVKSTISIYAVMGFVGFEIMWWFHKSIQSSFAIKGHDWFLDLRVTFFSILFLILGHHTLEEFVPSYRALKTTFSELFKGLSFFQVIIVSLMSSVGEEILFRGAIQPYIGIWFTSLLFAVMHIDPEGKTWAWTFWALVGGLVMGGAANISGSLWAPIMIHFGVNLISISRVVRYTSSSKNIHPNVQKSANIEE